LPSVPEHGEDMRFRAIAFLSTLLSVASVAGQLKGW
jgi:hypothetical protein